MNIVERAIMVAATAHDGQYRKSTKVPYISHPYNVGMILKSANCTDEVVSAGILHDTVEDTELTLHDIKEQFGEKVALIVEGCSEPHKEKAWEERKQHTIEYLKTAPIEIKLVAAADKLHNLTSTLQNLEEHGEVTWERFKRGKEKQQWYYTNVLNSLVTNVPDEEQINTIFTKLKETVEKVFGKL